MRHNKSGSREFTHVYVAKCGRFTKIGATTDVAGRIRALGAAKKGAGRLIESWQHDKAYEVEGTTIWLLRYEYQRREREWFLVPVKVAVAAVERAIAMVDAGHTAPFTYKRAKRDKRRIEDEMLGEKMKTLIAEAEAWAAANPEQYERMCASLKRTDE